MDPRCPRWMGECKECQSRVPAVHGRRNRAAPRGPDPCRSLPDAPRRFLSSIGVRFRRAVLGSRRTRLPRRSPRRGGSDLDLASYDRLFPTQDFMPKGSFGNLIALPLQGQHLQRDMTAFLDPATLEPFGDQWECLSSIESLSIEALDSLASGIGELATGPDARTYRRPSKLSADATPPPEIPAQGWAMLAVDRIGVPPALVAALKHLASLHNPEFFKKERLRFSTWDTPRFIRC